MHTQCQQNVLMVSIRVHDVVQRQGLLLHGVKYPSSASMARR
jgi:hypothetical protein